MSIVRPRWSSLLSLVGSAMLLGPACVEDLEREPVLDDYKVLGGTPDDTAAVVAIIVGDASATGMHSCSGTVVERNVVLTAAHCVDDAIWVEIFTGTDVPDAFFPGDGIAAEAFFDPGFDERPVDSGRPSNYTTAGHDVALVVATDRLDIGIAPRRLWTDRLTDDVFATGTDARIVGYGNDGLGGSGIRLSAPIDLRHVYANHLEIEPRACSGDSGGPLLLTVGGQEYVVGLSSYSLQPVGTTRCQDRVASEYLRVDTALPWIRWQLERLRQQSRIASPYTNHVVPPFSDLLVEGRPTAAIGEIVELRRIGAIGGFPDGRFRPDEPLTRAQFAAILAQTFLRDAPLAPAASFVDVAPDHWAKASIDRVVRAGYMSGFPDGTFAPDATILRVQTWAALSSVVASAYERPAAGSFAALTSRWADAASVPAWARAAVARVDDAQVLHNASFFGSNAARRLRPADSTTRGEVASYVWQVHMRLGVELYPCSFFGGAPTYCD